MTIKNALEKIPGERDIVTLCTPEQKELVRKMHTDKAIPLSIITDTFKISKATMYNVVYEGKVKDGVKKLENN